MQITTKRNSSIELLRIISMLLVLVVHANFLSLSEPTHLETIETPIISFTRYLIQSLSIVCVNVFILISGYFGIRANLKKISSLLYQVYFWIFFINFILNVFHLEENKNTGEWISSFLLFDYWFIRAYIILYIISPLLNTFIINSSPLKIYHFLLSFFILQTVYSFYRDSFFQIGYSPISFIGLYVLAGYIRLYPPKWSLLNIRLDFALYALFAFLLSSIEFIQNRFSILASFNHYGYSHPIVIASSIFLFLAFTKMQFYNSVINSIGASSFAVYLLHCHGSFLETYYCTTINQWFKSQHTINFIVYTVGFIIIVYVSAIIIDKFRLLTWNNLFIKLFKNIDHEKL